MNIQMLNSVLEEKLAGSVTGGILKEANPHGKGQSMKFIVQVPSRTSANQVIDGVEAMLRSQPGLKNFVERMGGSFVGIDRVGIGMIIGAEIAKCRITLNTALLNDPPSFDVTTIEPPPAI